MVDVKKRLEEARRKARGPELEGEQAGGEGDPLRPWSAKHFRVGDLEFQDLQIDGPADNEAFLKMARELGAGLTAAPAVEASPHGAGRLPHAGG